jgi:murein DD-endopeptidase MepM/ murein hydrolase activator NlpD
MIQSSRALLMCFSGLLIAQCSLLADLIWPTPNPAFQEGLGIESYIQSTASGITSSGLFGCVRNGGARFHEGLDLYPIKRTRTGEPADKVYSILPGRVVHTNTVAGYSSYGRYVVIEHDQEVPAYHTLYAHLASVDKAIKPGVRVNSGSEIGIMGRSAAGYSIPKERGHLHFEIGFRLTNTFDAWYGEQKFGSKNRHGNWNGMNLVSIDPLDFYQSIRSGEIENVYEYLQKQSAVARIQIYTSKIPDFVRLYPALVTRPYEAADVIAWDIAFTAYGLPKAWTPRFASEGLEGRAGDVRIIAYDPSTLADQSCRKVVDVTGGQTSLNSATLSTLQKLFGFK